MNNGDSTGAAQTAQGILHSNQATFAAKEMGAIIIVVDKTNNISLSSNVDSRTIAQLLAAALNATMQHWPAPEKSLITVPTVGAPKKIIT